MEKINGLIDIEGTEFPAGRRTRVVVGVDSPLQAQHFVQGIVMIHPGGAILFPFTQNFGQCLK